MPRIIFHIDVNAAFLSWSAAYNCLCGSNLDYRTIPAVVCHSRKEQGGIVLAKSDLAKAKGIYTGETLVSARIKCPDLTIIQPNFPLYLQNSRAMREILYQYSPDVEPYSIDECFVDYTGSEKLFGDPMTAAKLISNRIHRELGFTVNVGIGDNKVLAKMASELEKPNKIHTIFCHEIPHKLWKLPIDDLFMAGHKSVEKLRRSGISTIGQFAAQDISLAKMILGDKHGEMLWNYANGIDNSPVITYGAMPEQKSMAQAVTLPYKINDIADARLILLNIVDNLGQKLRNANKTATLVGIALKDEDYGYYRKQRNVPHGVRNSNAIFREAMEIMKSIYPKKNIIYVSVTLGNFREGNNLINSLWGDDNRKESRLNDTVDAIRQRYGTHIIQRTSLVRGDTYKLFKNLEDEDINDLPRFY